MDCTMKNVQSIYDTPQVCALMFMLYLDFKTGSVILVLPFKNSYKRRNAEGVNDGKIRDIIVISPCNFAVC